MRHAHLNVLVAEVKHEVVDAGLEPWDIAAAALIVEESGGRVSRPDGRPLNLLDREQGLLASNGHVHDQLLDQIRAAETTPDQ